MPPCSFAVLAPSAEIPISLPFLRGVIRVGQGDHDDVPGSYPEQETGDLCPPRVASSAGGQRPHDVAIFRWDTNPLFCPRMDSYIHHILNVPPILRRYSVEGKGNAIRAMGFFHNPMAEVMRLAWA